MNVRKRLELYFDRSDLLSIDSMEGLGTKVRFLYRWKEGERMLRILIAEDEDFERKALKYLINKNFHKDKVAISEASNGRRPWIKQYYLNQI